VFPSEVGVHNNGTDGAMCSNSRQASGGHARVQGGNVLSYKRCGRGLIGGVA